jgi:hypothetical protein
MLTGDGFVARWSEMSAVTAGALPVAIRAIAGASKLALHMLVAVWSEVACAVTARARPISADTTPSCAVLASDYLAAVTAKMDAVAVVTVFPSPAWVARAEASSTSADAVFRPAVLTSDKHAAIGSIMVWVTVIAVCPSPIRVTWHPWLACPIIRFPAMCNTMLTSD